jgi:hypothetical protein
VSFPVPLAPVLRGEGWTSPRKVDRGLTAALSTWPPIPYPEI